MLNKFQMIDDIGFDDIGVGGGGGGGVGVCTLPSCTEFFCNSRNTWSYWDKTLVK